MHFFVFYMYHFFEMQEKVHNVLFQPRRNLDFGHSMAAVHVQSFWLIKLTIAFLFKLLFQDFPNVPNLFINNKIVHSPQTIAWHYYTVIATVN
jgi:hypothetical protein